jgi:signal transduction histidine kinase/PAS domain-containing protein
MAVLTLAYSAAAGAMTLALTTTYLAFRQRRHYQQRSDGLQADLEARDATLGELDTATSAFEEAFLALEGGEVRLVWGEEVLIACARALGLKSAKNADCANLVVKLLSESSDEAAAGLSELTERGKQCRFEVFAENRQALPVHGVTGLSMVVEGKTTGGTSWLRLAITGHKPSLSSGPFALLANQIPAPCAVMTRDARPVFANQAYLKALGVADLQEVINNSLSLDRGLDALVVEAGEQRLKRESFRWISVSGERRAFQLLAEPLNETYTAATLIDVTEAEESREILKRHAKAHDETLNALEDAVAIFGPERALNFHNLAFEKMWDLEPAWLAERPTHAEWLDRLRQKRKLPETGDYSSFKARELDFYGITQPAADEMWSLSDGRSIRLVRQPHPLGGLVIVFSDRTGELNLKAQFNSLIQVQKATLDQIGEVVCVYGTDGRLKLKNLEFDRFWRLRPEEKSHIVDFDGFAQMGQSLIPDKGFWNNLKGRITDIDPVLRAPQVGEIKLKDGRLAQWRTKPLPDTATLVVFSDVTATRELEEAISQRDAALSESARLKRDFVGNVSYELRTPLTTIVGYAELLKSKALLTDPRHQGYIDAIHTSAKELARGIDDVLDMALIDAGEMEIVPKAIKRRHVEVMIREHVEDLLNLRQLKLVIEGMGVNEAMVADPKRLVQMLGALTEYAARQANTGSTLVVSLSQEVSDLVMKVAYEGRGIPYHVQANIFDRFIGRERGGPGLALALVKALVELHKGIITLESDPHQGALFTIRLPQIDISQVPEDMPTPVIVKPKRRTKLAPK